MEMNAPECGSSVRRWKLRRGKLPRIPESMAATVVEKMRAGTGNLGFDAAREVFVDLSEAGIVDPTKVVRLALENAVSVASVLLRTDATMTAIPEEKRHSHESEPYGGG